MRRKKYKAYSLEISVLCSNLLIHEPSMVQQFINYKIIRHLIQLYQYVPFESELTELQRRETEEQEEIRINILKMLTISIDKYLQIPLQVVLNKK